MKEKKIATIFIICLLLLFALSLLFSYFKKNIKKNPEGTIGNTAGNLINGGTFCQSNDTVYFANAYDENKLYRMNADETNIKKLSNSQAKYINVGGKYLYYYQENASGDAGLGFMRKVHGIFRTNLNGKKGVSMLRGNSGIMNLINNTLYYQHSEGNKGGALYQINTNKSNNYMVDSAMISPASVQDGQIYFQGMEDNHFLYRLDTTDNSIHTVWEADIWNPIIQGEYVYYMDVSGNYRLCRYSLSEEKVEVLTNDRVDTFNVYESYIYYQKNSATEPALKRINIDGSNEEVIADGNYTNINITSNYVYFNLFDSPTPVYRTSTSGSVSVSKFEAASAAALENLK